MEWMQYSLHSFNSLLLFISPVDLNVVLPCLSLMDMNDVQSLQQFIPKNER